MIDILRVPSNEKFVTGHILTTPGAITYLITAGVSPEFFAEDKARRVMEVMYDLFRDGRLSSIEVVKAEIDARGLPITQQDLSDMVSSGWTDRDDLPYHMDRVVKAKKLRTFHSVLTDTLDAIQAQHGDLDRKIRAAESGTDRQLGIYASLKDNVRYGDQLAQMAFEQIDNPQAESRFLPTGLISLDDMITGLPVGRVTIVAARPSHAKTVTASQIALNCARRWHRSGERKQVVYFTAEVSNRDMASRILANLAGVDALKLESGSLDEGERRRVGEAVELLTNLGLTYDEETRPTTAYMMARLLSESVRCPVGLTVFDYLEFTGERSSEGKKTLDLEQALLGTHELARRFNIPFIVVSQLSRATEQGDGTPHLSHLAWSSFAEKVASLVLMCHHPHTFWNQVGREGAEPMPNDYFLFVRKNTRGPIGGFELRLHKHLLKLEDLREERYRPIEEHLPF
jgi:replicative DNA helicase